LRTYATRDWRATPDGMELTLSVEVNGKTAQVRQVIDDMTRYSMTSPPPARYIEREMRRKLMAHVEDEMLGPCP
jgi:hypothetical protein